MYPKQKGKRHRCGVAQCYSCKELVDLSTHKCFIQPADVPVDEENEEVEDEQNKKPLDPLLVYANIEALQEPHRSFTPILLCYRHSEKESFHALRGEDCCWQFIYDLIDLTEVSDDERDRPIVVLFHNLKGFDGMFIINELYADMRTVETQLTVGAKVLSFNCGPLTFKDSLCFLSYPLADFPETFGLTELKKGFFLHEFNTHQNQNYVGRNPNLDNYDPDGMKPDKKKELEEWHKEQDSIVNVHVAMVGDCFV